MSNVGAQNRFLQSNLRSNKLATETTLKNISNILDTGTVEVDFPANTVLDVQTNGLTNKVQVAINSSDVVGDIQVASSTLALENGNLGTINTNTASSLANLTSIDAKLPTIGQQLSSASQSIVVASDHNLPISSEVIRDEYKYQNVEKRQYIFNEHWANIKDNPTFSLGNTADPIDYKGYEASAGGIQTEFRKVISREKYIVWEFTISTDDISAASPANQCELLIKTEDGAQDITHNYCIDLEDDTMDVVLIQSEAGGSTYTETISASSFLFDKFNGTGKSGLTLPADFENINRTFRVILNQYGNAWWQIWAENINNWVLFHQTNINSNTSAIKDNAIYGDSYKVIFREQNAGVEMLLKGFCLYLTNDSSELNLPHKPSNLDLALTNLSINSLPSSELNHLFLRGYNVNVDNGGFSEVSDGFVNSGEFLTLPSSAITSFEVVSDDANDTSAGTGARTIRVNYVSEDGVLSGQNITMNGTTTVSSATIGANVCFRFINAVVLTAGSGNENAGRITIHETGTAANIYEQINDGNNVSASAKAYIPRYKTVFFNTFNAHPYNNAGDDSEFILQIKESSSSVWKNFQTWSVKGSDQSAVQWDLRGLKFNVKQLNPASNDGIDFRFIAEKKSNGGQCIVGVNLLGYYK